MRLATLVETSNGALVRMAGADGDPDVDAVITTDLLAPRRYLSGGELVLTGLAWWRPGRPARSAGFVASLVDGGAVALAAGEAEHGQIPADLVTACAEAGLPLLRVPVEHSFAAVIERATRQLTGREDLAAVLARHRALVTARDGGAGLSAVVDLVAADLGVRCWVLSPTGRVLSGPDLDAHTAEQLARQFLRAPRLPYVVRGVTLFAAGPDSPRAAAWALAVESDHTGWRENRRGAVEELASLAALEHGSARRRSDVERQLVVALAASAREEAAAAAERCGLDLTAPTVVVRGVGTLAAVVIEEAFSRVDGAPGSGGGWVLGEAGAEVVAVVPGSSSAVVAALRSTLDILDPGLGAGSVRLGVSDAVTGADGLLGALAEARAAVQAAATDRAGVAGPEVLSSHAFLLAAVPAELRAAYRSRVLGPLLEQDRAHRTNLVATLRIYLECSGSWARCAERMHVHVNTLRYRIERIEALTNRDLRRLDHQADLLLALELLR